MASKQNSSHPLRCADRPQFEAGGSSVRVVDLFCGCGGLTLGVAQAARSLDISLDVALAMDSDPLGLNVYAANFPKANCEEADVTTRFSGALGARLSRSERESRETLSDIDLLVGGPPCQGHSNLNNHTRRDDPKNALYQRMIRAVEVLQPKVVVIENVPAVLHDKGAVVGASIKQLTRLGYSFSSAIVSLMPFGVAQSRRRHLLLASRIAEVDVGAILQDICAAKSSHPRDLAWAIRDLAAIESSTLFDTPPVPSKENLKRMQWMLDNDKFDLPNAKRPRCHQDDHSYKSMYGRLRWDAPAQTLTSGYGSIGQGRYMHPDCPRALTPHEAARIQGFPDYFSFDLITTRSALATMIGNAVPPQLLEALGVPILKVLTQRD